MKAKVIKTGKVHDVVETYPPSKELLDKRLTDLGMAPWPAGSVHLSDGTLYWDYEVEILGS